MSDDGGHDPGVCEEVSCREAFARGDKWLNKYLSLSDNPESSSHSKCSFHHREELHENVRLDYIEKFQTVCALYESVPDDFFAAWHYLSGHPIFHKPTLKTDKLFGDLTEEEKEESLNPQFVDYDRGLDGLDVFVGKDAQGNTEVFLEHGPYVWPSDVNEELLPMWPAGGQLIGIDGALYVSADSYEKAIVELAKRVSLVFGNDRSEVPLYFS